MEVLLLVVGFMLAAVVLVGVGDRLRLPWPALMVVLGLGVAFSPGLPDTFALDPDLILPLFLPPLLFATAQRTSWALFRSRWRSIAFLAVALVVATVATVAATAAAALPGLGLPAAVTLGAMVAPPDRWRWRPSPARCGCRAGCSPCCRARSCSTTRPRW